MFRWVWFLLVPVIVWGCSESGPPGGATELVIEHVVEGDGPSPSAEDVVRVHYHGTLPDGTVFDSTRATNRPATFPLRRVVACWKQGLQQMKVGGKAKLICPPQLAYGERGAPPRIPPNATLHFDVELLAIQ
ncbi:MAG: FKBP-type peptidyl-prolyl cis-trans isomerase [Myxococcales bacterium]|nr:FKBP-type peptidyl-prolyl cis-trans isomerase [Myxococcales bacterium]